jgi:hypothetical protein
MTKTGSTAKVLWSLMKKQAEEEQGNTRDVA